MMRCEEALREYSALLDSELAAEAVAPLRVHLEHCTACAEEARRFLRLHELRGALHSDLFLDPGRAGLAESAWRRRLERRRRVRLWVPAAAAAAVLVGVLLALREGAHGARSSPGTGTTGTILVLPGGGQARMEEGGAAEPVEGAVKQTGGSVRYQPGSDLRIDTAAGALVARAGSDVRVTVYPDGDPRRSEVLRRHGLDPRGGPLAVVQCLDGAVTGGVVAAGGTERVLRPAEPRRARERERAPEAESAPPRSDAPRPAIVRKPQAPAPAPEPGPRARTGARKIQGSVTGLTDAERLEVGVYPLAPRVGQPLPPLRRERRTRPGEGGAWVLETPEDWPRRVAVYLVQQGRVTDVRQGDPGGSVDFRPRTRARVRSFEGTVVDRETFLPLKAAITVADPETSSLLWEPLTCRADGSFAAMIPSFEWRIEARAPGFGAALLEAEMGGAMRTSDLQLQLLPEGRIEGRVVDQRGRPVRATMDLRKPAGSRAAWDSAELPATDDQGRFQVRGLAEGEYQLVARPVEPAQPPTVVPVRVGRRRTTGTLVRVESAPMRFLMLESHLGGEESTWWEGRIELLDERKVLVAEDTLTLREQSWRRALPAGQYRVRIDGIGTEPVDQVVDFRTAVHANISLRPR